MNAPDQTAAIILVAEDEAFIRMFAADVLADEGGYGVIEVRTADEALEILDKRHDVGVLFTDVDMPGSLNGFALARIVGMRWPGIGVLVTSGKGSPRPGDLPKEARFLPKPYSPSGLVSEVRSLLANLSGLNRIERAVPADEAGAAVVPAAINLGQPQAGIGLAGGLAQPLPEPNEQAPPSLD